MAKSVDDQTPQVGISTPKGNILAVFVNSRLTAITIPIIFLNLLTLIYVGLFREIYWFFPLILVFSFCYIVFYVHKNPEATVAFSHAFEMAKMQNEFGQKNKNLENIEEAEIVEGEPVEQYQTEITVKQNK